MGDDTLLQAKIIISGTIVEFLQDNTVQIAYVIEAQNEKLKLMLPNRRETSLSTNRILPWIGPYYSDSKSKDDIINLLNKHKEERKHIQQNLDVYALWEMVQGEVKTEQIKFFADFFHTNPSFDILAGFANALLEHKTYFKFQNPCFEVYTTEIVEQKLEIEKQNKDKEVLVGTGANWYNYLWELHLKDLVYDGNSDLEPKDEMAKKFEQLLKSRIVDPESQYDEGLWKQIVKKLPENNHLALLIATAWGIVPKHYNYWLAAADFDPSPNFADEFSDEFQYAENLMASLEELGDEPKTTKLREYNFSGTQKLYSKDITNFKSNEISSLSLQLSQKFNKNEQKTVHTEDKKSNLKNPLPYSNDFSELKQFFEPFFAKDFISIDSASTNDIDDAFSLEKDEEGNFDVYIALACPACIWKFNSDFDKLFLQRSTSLYLPEATYHMLPHKFSTDLFSLNSGKIKPCLICHCKIAPSGELVESSFDFMRAKIADNLHYQACEFVLNSNDNDEKSSEILHNSENENDFFLNYMEKDFDQTEKTSQPNVNPIARENAEKYLTQLETALEFAKIRLNWRIEQGAVIIEKPDLSIELEQIDNTEDINVKLELQTANPKAQLIVSELMVLANSALANFAITNDLSLIFRTQDIALPKEMAGVWTKPQDIAKVARCLSSANTETNPKPHAGLGIKTYSPVTSPLRRYIDLVNEAQLLHFLYAKEKLWNKEEMDNLLLNIHIYNDKVNLVQRMRPKYWLFVYLQQEAKRQGEKCGFKAIISDENDTYVTVTLCKEQITVRAKHHIFGEKAVPGQEVMLRLGKINPLKQEVSILASEFLN